jgi:CMP-N-acetylneuraminic acid synthetase
MIRGNGAFYVSRRTMLEAGEARLHGRVIVYEMAPYAGIELDEAHDWSTLERAFKEAKRV